MAVSPPLDVLDVWLLFSVFLVVFVFFVDPGIVRDAREISFPALGSRFRAQGVVGHRAPSGHNANWGIFLHAVWGGHCSHDSVCSAVVVVEALLRGYRLRHRETLRSRLEGGSVQDG